MKVILLFMNLLLLFIIIKCDTEDQKYFFQLYPSQDKNKPYLFYAYIPPSNLMTINTTEKDNCTIIDNSKTTESAIKNLSSIIIYKNDLLIKTCFNPDILVEIKNETIYKKNSKILSKVKYCYSTAIHSPNITDNQAEYVIITYWIEYELNDGKEVYTHKCMLYYINKQKFSEEIILKTTENFYSEKCITLRGIDIFCSIFSEKYDNNTYFVIETHRLFKNENNYLVFSNVAKEKDIYQKIISTNLGLYDKITESFCDVFIIEYHNKKKDITKLNFQIYKIGQRKTLSFKDANLHSPELLIEREYIEPDLFNMIFQKTNDTIISYIMKVGKNTNYLLSRANLTKSIKIKDSTQLVSNFLRDDICSNPKYMQTNFMTSFINYNEKDKSIINSKGGQNYYKYQKDIVSLITCLNKDNKVEYEPKKIVLPQCLNILDELNNMNYHVIEFSSNKNSTEFDIYGDPIYKSLRNVDIQFYPGETEGNILINYRNMSSKNYSYGEKDFNKPLRNISHIKFISTNKMKYINRKLTLKYRLLQSTIENNSTYTCHLSSDICELSFIFTTNPSPGGSDEPITPYCQISYCINIDSINCKCKQCNTSIEGIVLNKDSTKCICDVRRGFKEDPDENEICVCKEGYSYYKDRKQCLPNKYLEECKCFIKYDDLTLIRIYDDCPKDKIVLEVNGTCIIINKSLCLDPNNLDMNLWFKLKEYKFYYAKINDCVYIFDDKNLTLFFYSNREDCTFENDIIVKFIRFCLNKPELTGVVAYMKFLDSAKEYDPNATDVTIFKKIEEKDSKIKTILFNLVNGQSQENISDVIIPQTIISEIKNISDIPEELNLLVFKADMTRNDTVSTQVEYQFYNPIPSKIHQKIIFEKSLNDTGLRRLDDDDDEIRIYISKKDFELKLNLPIQWKPEELEIIDELYHEKHIFLFNPSDPFYLDVCYNYTTRNTSDIYLQDRKEKYYIHHPFCEEGCKLIDDKNYYSYKITCKCSWKIINDNYTNTSFYEIEPDEKFKEVYIFPNVRVVGCVEKIKLFKKVIDYFNLVLFGVFFITHLIRMRFYNNNNAFKRLIKTIELNIAFHKKDQGENVNTKDDDDKEHKIETDKKKIKKMKKENKKEKKRIKAYDDDIEDISENEEDGNGDEEEDEDEDENKSLNKSNKEAPAKNIFSSHINKEDDEDMKYSEDDNKSINKKSELISQNDSNLISERNPDEIRGELDEQFQKSSERKMVQGKTSKLIISDKENNNDYIYDSDDSKSYQTIYLNRILDRFRYKKAKKNDHRSFCEMFKGMISNNCTLFFILNIQNLFECNTEKKGINKNLNENEKEEKKIDFEEEEGKEKDTKVEDEKENKVEEEKIIRIEVQSKNKKKLHNIKNEKEKEKENENETIKENETKKENKDENKNQNKNQNKKKKRPEDGNDFYTIISVLILTICLYLFVNILIMTKGYSLHLYLRKDKEKFSFSSFLTNLFLPYLIFYISILRLKQAVSIKEFMDEQYYRFFTSLSIYYSKRNGKNESINNLYLQLHNIEAKISKKKNEHQKGMKRIFFGGSIFILLNWYLMSCFLGIYINSYDCLFVNLTISVLSSILVSLLVYLISASCRRCALKEEEDKDKGKDKDKDKEKKKKSKIIKFFKKIQFYISQLFNPQYKFFCFCCCFKSCFSCSLFKCLSKLCSLLCCCCFNEDNFDEYKEEIKNEEKEKERKRKKKEEKKKMEKEKKKKEQKEKEQMKKEQKEKEQKEKEKNLMIVNDDEDEKSSDYKKENKSQRSENTLSIFINKKKIEEEMKKKQDMDETF